MKYDVNVNLTTLYDEFVENYAWLETVVKPLDGNRFTGVKSRLEEIVRNYDRTTSQLTKDFPERDVFLTSFEAKRFNQAAGYLRTLNRHHLPIAKIRSMCKGPSYHLEEIPSTGNSEGRNIQFEFILGAFLKKAGFQIQEFDDIQIVYASSLIRYECKRPAFMKNIPVRFDEAVSQLERKIANQENEYGIVALSVEKIDAFDQKLLRGDDITGVFDILIQSKSALLRGLRSRLRLPSRKRILGLHLFVSTFLWNKASGTFMDVSAHFTEKAVQNPAAPLHDYLFDTVRQKLEEA